MKRRIIHKICKGIKTSFFAVAALIVGIGFGVLNAEAGTTKIAALYKGEEQILTSEWNIPNDDLQVENGKIVFTPDSTSDTRLVTASSFKKTEGVDKIFDMNCSMSVESIPSGERFIIGFGVDSIEAYCEEAQSIELYMEYNDGVWAALRYYDESGETVELTEKLSLGKILGKNISVKVVATSDMKLTVSMNNKTLYDQKSPIDLEGRIMFTESSGCEVGISNIEIISHSYDRPSNSNFCEDFEKGTLNTSVLEARMGFGAGLMLPARMEITDYHGNKVLMLHKAAHFYLGTVQEYSNFECTFDMPYMLYNPILDESGNIVDQDHKQIIIGIACPPGAEESFPYEHGSEAIVIEKDVMYNWITKPTYKVNIDSNVYGDPGNNVGYSIKIRMVDSKLTVLFKSNVTGNYDEMMSYNLGESTPRGRIYICSGVSAECAIDNFKMTNLDEKGNVVDAGYSFFTAPNEDWEYEAYDAPYYTEPDNSEEEVPAWYIVVGISAISGMLFLVICVVFVILRKTSRRKKEVKTNEV